MKSQFEIVREVIRSRCTFKVLADVATPIDLGPTDSSDEFVRSSVENAGWAPFHYDRGHAGIAEPWRCHIIWHATCRKIATGLPHWFSNMKPNNKLPSMLSACGALVMVTWIPTLDSEIPDPEKRRSVDDEHLAATSAMTQNLLLLLTAGGFGTYWSSGGQLKSPEMFARLEIPTTERLAAAVFVEYPESKSLNLERLSGKNRTKRSSASSWTREIESILQ